MRSNKVHSIEELKQIYKDASPKFVGLKNPQGDFEVHYNPPVKKSAERFEQIVTRLNQKTLAPGLYTFCTKNSTMKNSTVNEYPIGVGKFDLQESPGITIHTKPAMSDSVWTVNKAIEVMTEKNLLSMQLEFEKQNNKFLTERVAELEKELDRFENAGTSNSWLKDAADTFKPLLDTWFTQRDRQITLEEKKLTVNNSKNTLNDSKRSDGGIHPSDSVNYTKYFENILKSGNEDDLNYECDYLESNFPDLYKKVAAHYKIEDLPDEEIKSE